MIVFHNICALTALILGGIGTIHYFIGIFKGQIKPHVMTWTIWALTTWVIGLVQYTDGGGVGAYVMMIFGVLASLTALLSVRYGLKNITLSDSISFVGALISVVLWYIVQTPLYTVLLLILIDLFAFYPSFRKGYQKPWEEGAFLFFMASIKFLLVFFALENVTFITGFYPFVLFLLNGLFTVMLLIRRRIMD